MVKNGDGIPNDVAQLRGRRLVIAVEADAGQRLAEGLVKQMTGGDTLTARFMRGSSSSSNRPLRFSSPRTTGPTFAGRIMRSGDGFGFCPSP